MTSPAAALFVDLLDEIARMRGRIASAFADERSESGLSDLEMVVLNAVTGAAHPPTVPQIGRSLGHARQVIQRAATALAAAGLIDWVENPDHKRAHRLVPTARGREAKAAADARGRAQAARLTDGMDHAVLERAVTSLRTVRGWIERDARDGPWTREGGRGVE